MLHVFIFIQTRIPIQAESSSKVAHFHIPFHFIEAVNAQSIPSVNPWPPIRLCRKRPDNNSLGTRVPVDRQRHAAGESVASPISVPMVVLTGSLHLIGRPFLALDELMRDLVDAHRLHSLLVVVRPILIYRTLKWQEETHDCNYNKEPPC